MGGRVLTEEMHGVPVDLGAMLLVGTVRIDVHLHLPIYLPIYTYYIYSDRGDARCTRRPGSDATGGHGKHYAASVRLSIYISGVPQPIYTYLSVCINIF